jgi:N-acetylglucosamine kinase-like BadF-type ATPase
MLIVGVDGGGTKTAACLLDVPASMLSQLQVQPLSRADLDVLVSRAACASLRVLFHPVKL